MTTGRLAFIDWMKALGITLIVVGHVAGAPINALTPPVYPKQLGVAFFVFVMGFGLARETRPLGQVFYKRLFELCVIAGVAAVLTSAWSLSTAGDLVESNYLPLLGGVNVFINDFPQNPTTWYIGTYLHLLLVWAFALRRVRVTFALLAAALVGEIVLRAALLAFAGAYVAYMQLPNWISVFLLGRAAAQHSLVMSTSRWPTVWLLIALGLLGLVVGRLASGNGTPFMRLELATPWSMLVTSAAVSATYIGWTALCFLVVRNAALPALVGFLARNTLVVFIAHMPLFFVLGDAVAGRWPDYPIRAGLLLLACLLLPACLGELVRAPLNRVRDRLGDRVFHRPAQSVAA